MREEALTSHQLSAPVVADIWVCTFDKLLVELGDRLLDLGTQGLIGDKVKVQLLELLLLGLEQRHKLRLLLAKA